MPRFARILLPLVAATLLGGFTAAPSARRVAATGPVALARYEGHHFALRRLRFADARTHRPACTAVPCAGVTTDALGASMALYDAAPSPAVWEVTLAGALLALFGASATATAAFGLVTRRLFPTTPAMSMDDLRADWPQLSQPQPR